ncbi:cobalt-precorrin 5A hydrolase/precorrin-3B C17-methyltransferase [Kibdelosporangium banguiense]|uniref:Cobalt-precorrin 5A hydrolase/precorrin-3B C17-methyltransferase n=1 Tax=Kibdelosporangium banguiense TaxID=1365924 RepID=A0ABS4TM27_9PSEU|nr:cobalamin biosynthesis protein [Kibdelosporangium banguiense]MBP2325471.1 cobalt-precorrin 5A hydrolase/precorrin-3B C17-methyltransferase [Kibdelosporangium banguiense]
MIGLFAVTAQGKRAAAGLALGPDTVLVDGPVKPSLERLWPTLGSAVFFMGAGAAVRLVAPLLENKRDDPGVVCVHEGFVIALTGAGNILAQAIAESLNVTVVTTSDYLGATPIDDLVETLDTAVDGDLAACGAAVLAGDPVRLLNPLGFLLPDLPGNLQPDNYGTEWTVLIDDRIPGLRPKGKLLRLIPKTLVVGVGSSKGVTHEAVTAALELLESEHELDPRAVRSFATIDIKAREPGIQEAVEDWGFWHGESDGSMPPLAVHTADALACVDVPNPAAGVQAEVGTPSVAEAAALLTARELGDQVELAAPKTSAGNVTVAAARILP